MSLEQFDVLVRRVFGEELDAAKADGHRKSAFQLDAIRNAGSHADVLISGPGWAPSIVGKNGTLMTGVSAVAAE